MTVRSSILERDGRNEKRKRRKKSNQEDNA